MSRRHAENLIRQGRVTIDGRVAVLGDRGNATDTVVAIDGVPLPVRPDLVYILLNKPEGVISTAHDPQGRETVVDLVGAETRLYPVGRLDFDSEGLLLMTNDGTLANLITHPRYEVEKVYLAMVKGSPGGEVLRSLVSGVEIEGGTAKAVRATIKDRAKGRTMIEVVLTEGKKRQIRLMFRELGHPVLRLVRTAIGPIRDGSLEPGSWRHLSVAEVQSLYKDAGATWDDAPAIINEEGTE